MVTRRRVLTGVGCVGLLSLAGCLGDEQETPDPEALDDGHTCDACGMVIAENFGPSGQLFFDGDHPPGRDGPARFDSIHEMVQYEVDSNRQGHETLAGYATDYSTVDYEIEEVDGTAYISTHPEEDAFSQINDLHFVVGHGIEGAMGPDALPFKDEDVAEALIDEYGGEIVSWDDLGDVF